jgi:hypothetical protein
MMDGMAWAKSRWNHRIDYALVTNISAFCKTHFLRCDEAQHFYLRVIDFVYWVNSLVGGEST